MMTVRYGEKVRRRVSGDGHVASARSQAIGRAMMTFRTVNRARTGWAMMTGQEYGMSTVNTRASSEECACRETGAGMRRGNTYGSRYDERAGERRGGRGKVGW